MTWTQRLGTVSCDRMSGKPETSHTCVSEGLSLSLAVSGTPCLGV